MHSNASLNVVTDPIDATGPAIVGNRVELQLFTTLRCNLRCTYCSLGVGEVVGSQRKPTYTLDQLETFIRRQLGGREIYVTFYGGEPTLNLEFMVATMQRFPDFRFQLQTNGTLLQRLPDAVLSRLSNVLVSIDGGERITDGYRGRGIYRKVVANVGAIRDRLGGTLTARVTWSDADTTFEEIDELTESFDYVYFQFVAQEGAYSEAALEKRRAVLSKLITRFFDGNSLYPLIPIMGMVRNKVLPSRVQELYAGMTQCRVSTHILNIMPDGKIYPCPDMTFLPSMLQGSVVENWLKPSPLQPTPEMPCNACEAFAFCRRNCMKNLYRAYVDDDAAYRSSVVEPICNLVRFMGKEIDRHDPQRWFGRAPLSVRDRVANSEVYEYVEIMP